MTGVLAVGRSQLAFIDKFAGQDFFILGGPDIIFLPTLSDYVRLFFSERPQKPIPAARPFPHFLAQLWLRIQPSQFGLKRLDRAAWDWKNVADRFANRECDGAGARKTPVHRERRMGPIGLDHSIEPDDSVFRAIHRPAHHQVPALRSFEQEWNLKRDHAQAEVSMGVKNTVTRQIFDHHAFAPRTSIPARAQVMSR